MKKTATHSTRSAGAVLAETRLAKGYSLDDVAETSGLTAEEVSRLETGEDVNRARTLRAAAALGLEESDIETT